MHLLFENYSSSAGLQNLSLEFRTSACTVLFDPRERVSVAILSALAGLDEVLSGSLKIDGIGHEDLINPKNLLSFFACVFDEGTMLANLSIRENLLLPWHKRFEGHPEKDFESEFKLWGQTLQIELDPNTRPAFLGASQRKFMGFIRGLMLEPRLLLIDDPYYNLNKAERQRILAFLQAAAKQQPMLIASTDDDITGRLADQVIDLSNLGLA